MGDQSSIAAASEHDTDRVRLVALSWYTIRLFSTTVLWYTRLDIPHPCLQLKLTLIHAITSPATAIGQPGQRVFYIQAFQAEKTYTVIIEKTQLQSLAVGVEQFLAEVARQNPNLEEAAADYVEEQMRINPPVDPIFRVGEIGLGYDQTRDRVVLFVRELLGRRSRNPNRGRSSASGAPARRSARWRAGERRSPAAAGRSVRSAGSRWSPRATSARRRTGTCTNDRAVS